MLIGMRAVGAPNVVQDHAALYYFIRSPKISQALELRERGK